MTTTVDRAEINRCNSLKSTGPKSPEGKERSKFNAVKHGMSAATPVLPGEDPDAFRDRLDAWAGALDPDDVVEQFLVERAAAAAWKIERADRFEAARAAAVVHQAGAAQQARRREEVDRLGRWLLPNAKRPFDSVLTQMVLDIVAPGIDADPSRAMIAAGLDRLRPIVDRLESSAEGCAWLIERWAELHEPLRWGFAWDIDQYVRAVRLSGHRPLEMPAEEWGFHMQRRYRGEPQGPLTGGYPEPAKEPTAAHKAEVDAEECRKLGRQLVKRLPENEAGVHAALLDLVERTIGRLTERAAAHAARSEAEAAERAERLGFDAGIEGERLRRYQFGCERSLRGTLDTLLKLRRGGKGQERSAAAEEDRSLALPGVEEEVPRQEDNASRSLGRASLPASRHPEEARQEPRPPEARSLDLPREGEPGPASGSAGASPSQIPVPISEARYEAIAPAAAPAPIQNDAIVPDAAQPPVQNEAIAPDVARRPIQNEATNPADDRPGPPVEAVAPTGDTRRMAPPSGPASLNGATETVKPAINGPSPVLPEIGSRHSLRGPQDASAIETV